MPIALPATILSLDRNHCVAAWNRTFIQIWRRATLVEDTRRMGELARAFLASQPDKINVLFLVEATSDVPGDEARKALIRFFDDIGPRTSCVAIVAEGGGFRAATVRSIGTALGLMFRRELPMKFVGTVDEGIATLAPHLAPAAGGAEGLRSAMTQLRAQIAEQDRTR